jgi:hypothetical protein
MKWWNALPPWKRAVLCGVPLIIGVTIIAKEAPVMWRLEKQGIQEDGVIVGYKIVRGRHTAYTPVVSIYRDGRTLEVYGRDVWGSRWYDVGAHVPVVSLPDVAPAIGNVWVRWSGVLLPLPFLIFGVVASSFEAMRVRKSVISPKPPLK